MNYYIPSKTWSHRVVKKIKDLNYNGIVFFDVDGVMIVNELVTLDFMEVYTWIKSFRKDLFVGCLTHRKTIPEIDKVSFNIEITIEEIIEVIPDGNKTKFLINMFDDCLHKILLVDDSSQGQEAEKLGFGFYIENSYQ